MVSFSLPRITDASPTLICLDIPLSVIKTLCLQPVKWLRYVGWAILFTDGYITRQSDPDSARVSDDEALSDTDVLFYIAPDLQTSRVVDISIAHRCGDSRQSFSSRDPDFPLEVRARDGACIYSADNTLTQASHLIPFARGSPWMSILAAERGFEVTDINDVRNGILLLNSVHGFMEKKCIAILHTPNDILRCSDIPSDTHISTDARLATLPNIGQRYTLHHIKLLPASAITLSAVASNNSDARFQNLQESKLPYPPILHYFYGLAVLLSYTSAEGQKNWEELNVWNRPGVSAETTPTAPDTETFGGNIASNMAEGQEGPSIMGNGDPQGCERMVLNYLAAFSQRRCMLREQEYKKKQKKEIESWLSNCAAAF
ncbi:hypothetical protein ONZ45_g12931 [Pleurotus djamor]|nr:hypothetical protein ONZ45_g12931 [Pleurotus djamor]